jgi:UDP-N-acetylglucosamine:LPS N-acetylglucosamine transferase
MQKNERLKILFLPAWYPSEKNPVAGIFIKEYAKAVSLYNEVVVLYSEGHNRNLRKIWDTISDKNEDGIRTIRIQHKNFFIPKVTYLFYLLSIKKTFRKLLKEDWMPNIIHVHVYSAGVPAIILGKIYKIPVVITEHFSAFSRHALARTEAIRARLVMNKADIILPVSKVYKKQLSHTG